MSNIFPVNQLGGSQGEMMVHFTSKGVCWGIPTSLEEVGLSLFRPSASLGKQASIKGNLDQLIFH